MRSKCPNLPSRGPEGQTEAVFVQMGKKAEDDYHHLVPSRYDLITSLSLGYMYKYIPWERITEPGTSVIASHLSTVMSYPLSCYIVNRDHVYFVIFYSSTVDSVITHRCPWTHWWVITEYVSREHTCRCLPRPKKLSLCMNC
jgi:hypothetical protein